MSERYFSEICEQLATAARAKGETDLAQLLRIAALQAARSGIRHDDGRIEDSRVGVWDWDVVNDRVFADRHFAEMFGVTAAEAAAGTPIIRWADAVHRHDIARLWEAIQAALQGQLFAVEYRIVTKGRTLWMHGRGLCTMGDDGRAIRFLGGMADITHQKTYDIARIAPR